MSRLFEPTEINGMRLDNRFVRSATWEGMAAEDGAVTPRLTQTMVALAKGGVGLIISGHAYVSPEGQAGPWQLGIHKDELGEGLTSMCDAVHRQAVKLWPNWPTPAILPPRPLPGRPRSWFPILKDLPILPVMN